MDKILRQELNEALGAAIAMGAAMTAGGVAGGVVGAKLGTAVRLRRCAQKYKKGTPEYKKCASFKTGTPAGRMYVKGSKTIKKGIDKLRGKKSVKEEFYEVFNIEENRQHYMDLCKRKYSGMPPQYKKCRAAVAKRFKR